MRMAASAGIPVVDVKLLSPAQEPILIAPRLDRGHGGKRAPFLSARSLLLAGQRDEAALLDLLAIMRAHCADFAADAKMLWKRLVFMRLIHEPGDDLRKIGFLYAGCGKWCLAPAYGLRLYPVTVGFEGEGQEMGQNRRLTLWDLMQSVNDFGMHQSQAQEYLQKQLRVLSGWKSLASQFAVYMSARDIEQLEPAMRYTQKEGVRFTMAGG